MPILVAENLRKSYGDVTLLDGVNLSIHEGERVGLVGSNGAGKSTLARILLGIETADFATCPKSPICRWTVRLATSCSTDSGPGRMRSGVTRQ
ncbi:MAG: ABC-F family ATP-binding cassette domain-containing protein [Deltaproteobacteria bacterium]|nr:ABC-F family ATP-binding cassette domain-containing protein [Deltaproteobacteria bacterium]